VQRARRRRYTRRRVPEASNEPKRGSKYAKPEENLACTRRRPNPAGRLAKWGQLGDILSSPGSSPQAAHPHALPKSVRLVLLSHPPRNGARGGTSPAGDVCGRFARCKRLGGAQGGLLWTRRALSTAGSLAGVSQPITWCRGQKRSLVYEKAVFRSAGPAAGR